jgi:hypoxanthine phosphoribosyltransferase
MKTKVKISWQDFEDMAHKLIKDIKSSKNKFDGIYGIPRGGLILAVYLSHQLNLPILAAPTKDTLIVDDISDEGKTLSSYKNRKIATLYSTSWTTVVPNWYARKKSSRDIWLIFPWENQETEKNYDNTMKPSKKEKR